MVSFLSAVVLGIRLSMSFCPRFSPVQSTHAMPNHCTFAVANDVAIGLFCGVTLVDNMGYFVMGDDALF